MGFRELDFYNDNLNSAKSPYDYEYRILHTDYESVLIVSNCKEHEDELDGEIKKTHSYDMTIAVADIAKYDDEQEFAKLKNLAFSLYDDLKDRFQLENMLDKRLWFPEICRHLADGKSIFDLEKLLDT